MIALRAGNEDEALQLFKQSLELDKQYWYSLYRIARIQRKKGDILKAIFSLYRIITVMPDNLEVNREFAHLLYELAKEQKKKGEAFRAKSLFLDGVASLKQVIEKGSADKKLKLFYMDILIAAEYIQDAQEYIDRLYRNYPDDPAIIERYVRYYNSFLQYRKAEELCEELNRLTGEENLNVLFLLGEIYYKRRRLEKALNVLTRCLEKSRELGFKKSEHAALNNLAQIDMYVGDYENARRKYSDILKRDRTFWQAQAGLAEVYIRKEEFSKAEQAVTELTKLVPETYFTLVKLKAMLEEGKRREQYRKRYRDQKSHS